MVKHGVAFVGCGYVADFYLTSLKNHASSIELVGAYDRAPERMRRFANGNGVKAYASLTEALADPAVEIVVNLTSPDQHYAVSSAALAAGKHVFSEKPLALSLADAEALVAEARERGLSLSAAPGSVLGESAQTLWRALREGLLGAPRLAFAELNDGLVHRAGVERWISPSGAPWPATDEYRTGCTLQHAGYAVTWLAAMFGPVRRIRAYSALLIPDKGPQTPTNYATPDFSVGCLEFDDGVVARITNSVVAPRDRQLRVFGEEGELRVNDIWSFSSPVTFRPVAKTSLERRLQDRFGIRPSRRLKPVRRTRMKAARHAAHMDFCAGIAEMGDALFRGRAPRLSAEFALHVTEVALALQHPDPGGADYVVTSSFPPIEPMSWAREPGAPDRDAQP